MTEKRVERPGGRRATDRTGFHPRENWHRDVWLLIITAFVAWSIIGQNNILDDVQEVQNQQREGRRIAVDTVCAATSAVIDAGRATITGGAESLDPEFARNLEKLGYPPIDVRRSQARQAARAYAKAIAERVQKATGVTGVVNADGTLNCKRLAALSRVD